MTDPSDPLLIERTILALLAGRGPGRSLDPTDVARAIGGAHPDGWGRVARPVRAAAVKLMKEGRLVILRKGKPVDPDDFRGIYKLALPPDADS
ncbi:MAG: DUF3253 domain-containing protein [Microvirga sp.]